ncbi:hypothetical protein [Sphingobium baderi]|uniref:TonB C-terminal domain-containing protein n=1 Tax=Sphingobium baderi TaxID=1332080 RepID=A0A0S3EZU4_9SPHN|nr:hypothetical protein [Sphingobium baderi]ALR20898.1 hypothetical protein ATN00_11915 [Sphingobium baderi]
MHNPSILARIGRWTAALVGVGLAASAPVAAQPVSPEQAPAAWIAYAETATRSITELLQADSEIASRLRTYLDATRPAPYQPTALLVVKIWVDGEGMVSRIDYPPFAHEQANADMQALIVGQKLASIPPRDMLLPMRIAVQLDAPTPASAPTDGQSASLNRT